MRKSLISTGGAMLDIMTAALSQSEKQNSHC